MPHAIILGDVHLGKGTNIGKTGIGANLNSRIADQLNLLEWTLDQAHERGVDDIIITGDVFEDPKPHPSLITMFLAWLKKCQAYDVHVHIILGNHDMLRSGMVFTSSLDIISEVELENVSIYKNVNTVLIGTAAFTLVPFRDRKSFSSNSNADAVAILRDSLVYELASIPVTYKKILVGHLAIEGSIPIGDEIDDMTNELFCPLDMFQGYDYVWMGHVHKPQIMKKSKPYVAHIGSMDISNFGETDHLKHIIIVDCDSEDNDFEMAFLPTRPLRKITISVPKDTEDTTAYVLEEIKKEKLDFNRSIVRVEVALSAPELKSINKSAIEKYLTAQGTFNVTAISESKKVALIKKDSNNTIDTKMDVASAIKTYAQTYVDAPVRDAFIELSMDIFNTYKAEAKE
jgi:DNA repair exonuclease SbcCD nuclease subunit